MKAKLSERVRPDSEVSRWVYDEIVLLEAELNEVRLALKSAEEQITERSEALAMAQEEQIRLRFELTLLNSSS